MSASHFFSKGNPQLPELDSRQLEDAPVLPPPPQPAVTRQSSVNSKWEVERDPGSLIPYNPIPEYSYPEVNREYLCTSYPEHVASVTPSEDLSYKKIDEPEGLRPDSPSRPGLGHSYYIWRKDTAGFVKERRICGFRRKAFFIIVGISCFIILGGIGLAAGLAIKLGKPQNSDSESQFDSSAPRGSETDLSVSIATTTSRNRITTSTPTPTTTTAIVGFTIPTGLYKITGLLSETSGILCPKLQIATDGSSIIYYEAAETATIEGSAGAYSAWKLTNIDQVYITSYPVAATPLPGDSQTEDDDAWEFPLGGSETSFWLADPDCKFQHSRIVTFANNGSAVIS
ncbi:hypothetical protein ABW19_dt0201819 [Dactylella cylindrospora]|nr:hypothetical protein ABW19_dt0201819 [Dactylella cylindrospora]